MDVTIEFSDLLDKTKILGEKAICDLTEADVESYLSFLGYPKVPSVTLKINAESESVLFMLSCKLFQECNSFVASKKKVKKDLEPYHLKLFGYIILNLGNRRRLSVHNPLFLKLIELEVPELDCNLEYFLDKLKNTLYLSTSLYGINGAYSSHSYNQILFSNNELNDVVRILINYLNIFNTFYKHTSSQNFTADDDDKLVRDILFTVLKQILVLLNILRFSNKLANDKLLTQLLIFTYYLYQCQLNGFHVIESVNENHISGANAEDGNDVLDDWSSVVDKISTNLLEIVQSPVQSGIFELLNIPKANKDKDGNVKEKKQSKPKVESVEELVEKLYGLFLILPKILKSVANNIDLIHTILKRIVEFIKGSDETFKKDIDDLSMNNVILIRSYFNILLVLKNSSLFIKYNTDNSVLKIINETLSFVMLQMYVLYKIFNSKDDLACENDESLRKQLEYYWNILVIISNIDLELMDTNVDQLFQLLYMDHKWCSEADLSQKTMLFLTDISKNIKNKSEKDVKTISDINEEDPLDASKHGKGQDAVKYLPSYNFISNLVVQYTNINQLGTFLEYVHTYYNKVDHFEAEILKQSPPDSQNSQESKRGTKRKSGSPLANVFKKRAKLSTGQSNSSDNDDKSYNELKSDDLETNFLNNYIVLSNIELLTANNNEIIKTFKILEKYNYGLYAIIIVYLSKLEFNIRNINKVAEQFLNLYKTLNFKCDSQSLMLMSQMIVTVRKLLSLFNPIEISQYYKQEADKENSQKESSDDATKYERELINKLLRVVMDVYKYVCDYSNKLLSKARNEVILNIIYHIILINNENLPIQESTDDDENSQEIDYRVKVLNMDINNILSKLLGSSDSNVYLFIAKNIKLFNNSGKVDEFIGNYLKLKGTDKYTNLSKELSLIYFQSFLASMGNLDKPSDDSEISHLTSIKEDLFENVNTFLENIIGLDNTQMVSDLLLCIDIVFKRLKVNQNKRPKLDNEEVVTKNDLVNLIILLEMVLYVLNYEVLVGINTCYSLIVGYKKDVSGQSKKKGAKKITNNIFDVIIAVKKIVLSSEYYNTEMEKKIVNLFVKYYYAFTICIIKYSREIGDSDAKAVDTENMTTAPIDLMNFNDSNDAIDSNNISLIIDSGQSYNTNTTLYELTNTPADYNSANVDLGATSNVDLSIGPNNIGLKNATDVVDEINKQFSENQNKKISSLKVFITSLLLNYLQQFKPKRTSRDVKRNQWDVYFIYKYIDTLKLNNCNNYSVEIFKEADILKNVLMFRSSSQNEKNGTNNCGDYDFNSYVAMVYENIHLINNKYIANIVLWNANSYHFIHGRPKVDEDSLENVLWSGSIFFKLYLLVLKIVEVLNSDGKYAFNLSKKNDEFQLFLKNLFNFDSILYNQIVRTLIQNLQSNDQETDINKYIMLFILINNYNKENFKYDIYDDICSLIRSRQKYINNKFGGRMSYNCVNDNNVSNQSMPTTYEKNITDEIVFNYLIINKLYNINSIVKADLIELAQLILNLLSKIDNVEEICKLTQIMLKLINLLVVNNIYKNINIIVYFYTQYNNIVLKGADNYRELIRFTNLIVNNNNYKYIKNFVPLVLNISIQTFYNIYNKKEVENVSLKKENTNKKLGESERKEDELNQLKYKEMCEKNKQMLKNNIMKCIMLCEDKVREGIYKTIRNSQIKLFFKSHFQNQK